MTEINCTQWFLEEVDYWDLLVEVVLRRLQDAGRIYRNSVWLVNTYEFKIALSVYIKEKHRFGEMPFGTGGKIV